MISLNLALSLVGLGLGYLMRNRLNDWFWRLIAWTVTRPAIRDWLIMRAMKTPYEHIKSADGSSVYMYRWWLFNPYPFGNQAEGDGHYIKWLPSIRIHQIMREDIDRDLHDHPWDARTIILDGWYQEQRPAVQDADGQWLFDKDCVGGVWTEAGQKNVRGVYPRRTGYTGTLKFGQYHRINQVSTGGVYTMFITHKYHGTWGFLVDGQKVPWREYLAKNKDAMATDSERVEVTA